MDPSLTPFVRATVPLDGSYLFDVWQVPSVKITGNDALPKLRRVAEEHFHGWGRESEPPVEIESGAFVMSGGRPGVTTFVRFYVNGTPNHAVANWFTDHDGTVFRVCARGAVSRSRNELMTVVQDSTATWKRLLPTHPLRSPWWKLFSA